MNPFMEKIFLETYGTILHLQSHRELSIDGSIHRALKAAVRACEISSKIVDNHHDLEIPGARELFEAPISKLDPAKCTHPIVNMIIEGGSNRVIGTCPNCDSKETCFLDQIGTTVLIEVNEYLKSRMKNALRDKK